ncbi:GatB/YqeY domain-containing protein [Frigidibacter sp. RF13]|uniref:GatB/YqeY domain-containing protein n=1 Tax=Frigidibacter sp. RF13 TaxID=2997340 RepID=UPI00226F1EE2|nr:GatB/YqeY domain-containing protein [Frigidibacter sp. RF13]MCY1127572.1 GatB/YqeY domain-containing protein [Frigidibacter sp. RF13]
MDLIDRIQSAQKEAMKAKDMGRLSTVRMILAAVKDREIAQRTAGAELGEADVLALLGKMVKQRQESAKVYQEGGRPELAEKELAEIKVIEDFLPKALSAEEVEAAVAAAIAEVGAQSIKDMGRVMGVLKAKYTGQMDFGAVGALIKARLG